MSLTMSLHRALVMLSSLVLPWLPSAKSRRHVGRNQALQDVVSACVCTLLSPTSSRTLSSSTRNRRVSQTRWARVHIFVCAFACAGVTLSPAGPLPSPALSASGNALSSPPQGAHGTLASPALAGLHLCCLGSLCQRPGWPLLTFMGQVESP